MNDLEDLVRQELRARVDSAEAKQVGEPGSVLLIGLGQRIRRARLRRRWGAGLGVMAVAAIALVFGLASFGTSAFKPEVLSLRPTVALTDTAATPAGWMPIAYGNAQISVPADWRVSSRPVCGHVGGGYVIVGTASRPIVNPRCRHASNMAAIRTLPTGHGQTRDRTGQINRIPVLGGQPAPRGYATFLAPTLHALITVRGPLANKVLGTLTRSPFSVVLERGRRLPVPSGWRWHDFGGIRFAAPAQFRTIKSHVWYPCRAAILSAQAVELVNATRAVGFSCPPFADLISSRGVVVGAGRYVAQHWSSRYGCRSLHGLHACFAMAGLGAPLELVVDVPGRHKPTVVDIGLAGNGAEARTIFESIRPS
jgi:hypothetical protein